MPRVVFGACMCGLFLASFGCEAPGPTGLDGFADPSSEEREPPGLEPPENAFTPPGASELEPTEPGEPWNPSATCPPGNWEVDSRIFKPPVGPFDRRPEGVPANAIELSCNYPTRIGFYCDGRPPSVMYGALAAENVEFWEVALFSYLIADRVPGTDEFVLRTGPYEHGILGTWSHQRQLILELCDPEELRTFLVQRRAREVVTAIKRLPCLVTDTFAENESGTGVWAHTSGSLSPEDIPQDKRLLSVLSFNLGAGIYPQRPSGRHYNAIRGIDYDEAGTSIRLANSFEVRWDNGDLGLREWTPLPSEPWGTYQNCSDPEWLIEPEDAPAVGDQLGELVLVLGDIE